MFSLLMAAQFAGGLYLRGDDLYRLCTGSIRDQEYCIGYVIGVVDGISTMQEVDKTFRICVPTKFDDGQMRDMVLKYLKDNPAQRTAHAGPIIFAATIAAFPCPK